jgi:hypothetical protein
MYAPSTSHTAPSMTYIIYIHIYTIHGPTKRTRTPQTKLTPTSHHQLGVGPSVDADGAEDREHGREALEGGSDGVRGIVICEIVKSCVVCLNGKGEEGLGEGGGGICDVHVCVCVEGAGIASTALMRLITLNKGKVNETKQEKGQWFRALVRALSCCLFFSFCLSFVFLFLLGRLP